MPSLSSPPSPLGSLPSTLRHNLDTLRRSPLSELSGALGDLGTFLPLTLALALQNAIDLPATLVTSGFFNIVTGAVFGIPLPVQPMKVPPTPTTPTLSPFQR